MAAEFPGAGRARVHVVRCPLSAAPISGNIIGPVSVEGLSTRDSPIAYMAVAESCQLASHAGQVVARSNDEVDVDDGLGHQARHCRASDVLDGHHELTKSVQVHAAERFEYSRPVEVVRDQDNGILRLRRHSACPDPVRPSGVMRAA